ncbi:hypothetical protein M427DRAFT_70381 [Gonapodya prolifera JEL478]|uniref:Cyclin N-terminal domain-containing protein n=1 Tax=Gonapodya prolifera (strain JEL478) TaxID=1344416 RepID=A0A139ADH4_GONPJ|nr:hypothetical protein M427DRAFT_70381 [Gonapodya prolifera JEL478]|eukprot:KXS14820.1 hypothetical protein M427DRAFT_70381 [Gonapodya prolifera JEL478]
MPSARTRSTTVSHPAVDTRLSNDTPLPSWEHRHASATYLEAPNIRHTTFVASEPLPPSLLDTAPVSSGPPLSGVASSVIAEAAGWSSSAPKNVDPAIKARDGNLVGALVNAKTRYRAPSSKWMPASATSTAWTGGVAVQQPQSVSASSSLAAVLPLPPTSFGVPVSIMHMPLSVSDRPPMHPTSNNTSDRPPRAPAPPAVVMAHAQPPLPPALTWNPWSAAAYYPYPPPDISNTAGDAVSLGEGQFAMREARDTRWNSGKAFDMNGSAETLTGYTNEPAEASLVVQVPQETKDQREARASIVMEGLIDFTCRLLTRLFHLPPTGPSSSSAGQSSSASPSSSLYPSPPRSPQSSPPSQNHPSLYSFLAHLMHRTRLGTATMLLAGFYLARLKRRNPECKGGWESGYKLGLAGVMVGSKYLYDDTYDSRAFSLSTRSLYSPAAVSSMERELLEYLSHGTHVRGSEWKTWVAYVADEVEARAGSSKSKARGWMLWRETCSVHGGEESRNGVGGSGCWCGEAVRERRDRAPAAGQVQAQASGYQSNGTPMVTNTGKSASPNWSQQGAEKGWREGLAGGWVGRGDQWDE